MKVDLRGFKSYMTTLVLDTGNDYLFIALIHDGEVNVYRELQTRKHAEKLLPLIENICQQSNVSSSEINRIIVGKGPGSFTGVRLAIALVKTWSMVNKVVVYAVESMRLYAYDQGPSLVVLNARGGRFYAAQYQDGQLVNGPYVIEASKLQQHDLNIPMISLDGPLNHLLAKFKTINEWLWEADHIQQTHHLLPLYLKDLT